MTKNERDTAIAMGLAAVVGAGGYLYWRNHRTVTIPSPVPPTPQSSPTSSTTLPPTPHTTPHTTMTTSTPGVHVVTTELKYQRNCYSCLYFYDVVEHLSNGTTRNAGVTVQAKDRCAGLKNVKYVGLKYLTNHNSTYYKYAVYAYFTNGTRKQVDTIWHKGKITQFVCN